MTNDRVATRVRIVISEDDRHSDGPLYHSLLSLAHRMGVAGVTVVRGVEGYGASSRVHSARSLRTSEDLPMGVEAVDGRERLGPFLERAVRLLESTGAGGLVTQEQVRVWGERWPDGAPS